MSTDFLFWKADSHSERLGPIMSRTDIRYVSQARMSALVLPTNRQATLCVVRRLAEILEVLAQQIDVTIVVIAYVSVTLTSDALLWAVCYAGEASRANHSRSRSRRTG